MRLIKYTEVDEASFEYELRIDFPAESQDPARIFESMAGLIHAFEQVDAHLAASVSVSLRPVVLLEEVRSSSLISKLRVVLESVDDEALRELDWKKLVGSYLVRAKKWLVGWLREREKVESRSELERLQEALLELARATDVRWIGVYEPIPIHVLVLDLLAIERALRPLQGSDKAEFVADGDRIELNTSFSVSEGPIEELAADRIETATKERILAVKKPDYLGQSMWELKDQGRTVKAKISDDGWLERFQNREIPVRPGDSLRAVVDMKVGFSEHDEIIFSHYTILEVKEVLPMTRWRQSNLFDESER